MLRTRKEQQAGQGDPQVGDRVEQGEVGTAHGGVADAAGGGMKAEGVRWRELGIEREIEFSYVMVVRRLRKGWRERGWGGAG
jgi:hypothetical protein